MNLENKYKEYSEEKVKTYKKEWDRDFFRDVSLIDLGEILFIVVGVLIFIYLSWKFQVEFIVALVIFYWFRIKWSEKKIITAKQFLVLGIRFLDENFKGRGVTKNGVAPHYQGHKRGFEDYINFWETKRNHLVARMIILNLFTLALLEIIRIN